MSFFYFFNLGRRQTQSLLTWSPQRSHVNVRMWMKTAVTVCLCPTSRFTTITSMTSSKMLRLTQSEQSKGQDSKSLFAFWAQCHVDILSVQDLHNSRVLVMLYIVWVRLCPHVFELCSSPSAPMYVHPSNVHCRYFTNSYVTTFVTITTTLSMNMFFNITET